VWFLDSPEQSLGFILADHGFDVWVGNVRGTRWSHGHISLSEKDKVFVACIICLSSYY
jgi:lysosomal acid lipase/cholesteryl ester hydrolase